MDDIDITITLSDGLSGAAQTSSASISPNAGAAFQEHLKNALGALLQEDRDLSTPTNIGSENPWPMHITINLYGLSFPGDVHGNSVPEPVPGESDSNVGGFPDSAPGGLTEDPAPFSDDGGSFPAQGEAGASLLEDTPVSTTPDGAASMPADPAGSQGPDAEADATWDSTGTSVLERVPNFEAESAGPAGPAGGPDPVLASAAQQPPQPLEPVKPVSGGADAAGPSLEEWKTLSAAPRAEVPISGMAKTRASGSLGVTQVNAAGAVTPITNVVPMGADRAYVTEKVGEIPRAPHAMFAHNGELMLSTISRNGISKSPIYSYSDHGGMQFRSELPDANESGNYGFSFGDGLHIVAEAWEGMVDYVAQSPDGPWVKSDYTHLNPHGYKNLKWGFGFKCPETGQEFMGFGNDKQPGVVITQEKGQWRTLSAPQDMLFPTSMGVVTGGPNDGARLVCSSTYNETRLHAVSAGGQTIKLGDFEGWSYMTVDHDARIAFVATEKGKVYWSAFDDLANWQECQYQDAGGNPLGNLGRCGELNVHPGSGRVILPAADRGHIGNNQPMERIGTTLYEAVPMDHTVVFRPIGRIEGAGLWELRTAAVGDSLYFGTGLASSQKQDAAPGAVYRISA